ncbi:DUF1080 domain-containing protein [Verrucomicrobiota bacterium]
MFRVAKVIFITVIVCGIAHAGSIDPDQKDWFNKHKRQKNAPKPETMLINTDPEPNLSEGFTSLFNGKDLTGWTPKGGPSKFEVKDGVLVGTCGSKSRSTYLCTDNADFTDFIFTCEVKWEVDGNSGIMFRAQAAGQKVLGPQAELEGFEKGRCWSAGIYGQSCGGWFYPLWLNEHKEVRRALKENEWNRLTIMARGNVVKTWLNGLPAANWVNDTYLKGFFGLQIHAGAKGTVHWRNIKVKTLSK